MHKHHFCANTLNETELPLTVPSGYTTFEHCWCNVAPTLCSLMVVSGCLLAEDYPTPHRSAHPLFWISFKGLIYFNRLYLAPYSTAEEEPARVASPICTLCLGTWSSSLWLHSMSHAETAYSTVYQENVATSEPETTIKQTVFNPYKF